jgi:bifunctional DNA-binding transcriptional regulator/antitoxin component of YhaV-PrlF toxin-antitoxin module
MDREFEATMDSEGHFEIPKEVRERHGFKDGTRLRIEERASEVVIKTVNQERTSRKNSTDAIDKAVGLLGTDGDVLNALMYERQSERHQENRGLRS